MHMHIHLSIMVLYCCSVFTFSFSVLSVSYVILLYILWRINNHLLTYCNVPTACVFSCNRLEGPGKQWQCMIRK